MGWLVRNYNRFLIGPLESPRWEGFDIHRFEGDFDKLALFDSAESAQDFLTRNPQLEEDFDAWVCTADRADWNHGTHGGPHCGPSFVQRRNLAKSSHQTHRG